MIDRRHLLALSAAAPLLGFFAGHNCPTDGLGISEDPGLDGFVFSGRGHGSGWKVKLQFINAGLRSHQFVKEGAE